MAMNAILAIIADGGRAIVVIYTEGEEIHYFLHYFIDSDKTLRWQPRPTPCKEAPGGEVCSSIKNNCAGGRNGSIMVAMFVCLCLASKKPSEREFLFPPERT
jgi:hypothetical protein